MMLAGERLRVSLVTTHVPLSRVSQELTSQRVEQVIRTTVSDLRRWFGIEAPQIAVCGLNPHAGEAGHLGLEEREVIEPTLARLAGELGEGVGLVGPLPSDTLFARYGGGSAPYDAVICMYHDQGLIPLKLLHFGESANLTLGLPVLRTSVDHGTAYDIAGRGQADASSMRYAMELAVRRMARGGGR
jgi:4-hydroxythreonine-4-phosphate dehydrogenase